MLVYRLQEGLTGFQLVEVGGLNSPIGHSYTHMWPEQVKSLIYSTFSEFRFGRFLKVGVIAVPTRYSPPLHGAMNLANPVLL